MQIKDLLLSEYDTEMKKARATLERVPEDKPDYKPHDKSTAIAKLAGHLAQLPVLGRYILTSEGLDFATAGMKPLVMENRAQLLEAFDGYVSDTRQKLAETSDGELEKHWKLSMGDKVIMQGSKYEMVRYLLLNHIIHHRAQLGIYLRLNGLPVPSIYGPSADES